MWNQFPVCGFEVLSEAESFIQILHRTPLYTMGTVRPWVPCRPSCLYLPWGRSGNNQVLENIKQEKAKELLLSPENLGKRQRVVGMER